MHYKEETPEEEEINCFHPAINQEHIIFPGLALTDLWVSS